MILAEQLKADEDNKGHIIKMLRTLIRSYDKDVMYSDKNTHHAMG